MKNYSTTRRATGRKTAVRSHANAVPSFTEDTATNSARTPYHALGGAEGMRVPAWAQHRSVYRAGGRTLYLIETDRVNDATLDLKRLSRAGWEVQVTEDPTGPATRIALTRRELAKAA